jgi:hypothetical protein
MKYAPASYNWPVRVSLPFGGPMLSPELVRSVLSGLEMEP